LDISDRNNYKLLDTYVPPSPVPSPPVTTTGPSAITGSANNNVVVISVSVAATVFTIALIVILVLFIKRSKRNKFERHENNNNNRIIDHEVVDEKDRGVNQQFHNKNLIDTSNNVNSGSNNNIEIISPKNGKAINIDSNTEAVIATIHKYNVPSIKDFLETLDQKYGSGLFTQYLDSFISESMDVLDILTLSNNDFESLGIKKIGIRQKIIREAEQYKI